MKANDGTGNTPLRDLWETPQELFDKLNEQYSFDVDCCADKNNTKCNLWFDDFEKRMPHKTHVCWMNPPFSIAWRMFEHFFKVVKTGIAIYRCDNLETALWQKVIFPHATWVFVPMGRISYEGLDGEGARFPSSLIGVNVEPPLELEGTILTVQGQEERTNISVARQPYKKKKKPKDTKEE